MTDGENVKGHGTFETESTTGKQPGIDKSIKDIYFAFNLSSPLFIILTQIIKKKKKKISDNMRDLFFLNCTNIFSGGSE